MKINDRVGAILGEDNGVIKFLGYGKYVGDEIPHEAVGLFAEICRQLKRPNPKILLDNGKVVYGCECWWGSEDKIKEILKEAEANGKKIMVVDIDDIRKQYYNEQEKSKK